MSKRSDVTEPHYYCRDHVLSITDFYGQIQTPGYSQESTTFGSDKQGTDNTRSTPVSASSRSFVLPCPVIRYSGERERLQGNECVPHAHVKPNNVNFETDTKPIPHIGKA